MEVRKLYVLFLYDFFFFLRDFMFSQECVETS